MTICLFLLFGHSLLLFLFGFWDRFWDRFWGTEMPNHLRREIFERVHFLFGLIEFLEEEDNTYSAYDSGYHHDCISINGNHLYCNRSLSF
jgi:hypothetical protein